MKEAKTSEELLKLDLPKWPQCIITGTKISEEAALEIIRRTDNCFKSAWVTGNDKEYNQWIQETLHMPILRDTTEDCSDFWGKSREWQDKWGFIFLQYLANDWVNSCMIQGAQGWCHPDGEIGYFYNIGKWPEVEEVLAELKLIAINFPFLELECTLMSDEYGELDSKPIVSFLVRNGHVDLVDPEFRSIHEEFHRNVPSPSEVSKQALSNLNTILMKSYDSAISRDILQRWGELMK